MAHTAFLWGSRIRKTHRMTSRKITNPFAVYTYLSFIAVMSSIIFIDRPLALMFRAHKYEDFGGYRLWFSAFEQFGNSALYLVPAGIIVLMYWLQKRWHNMPTLVSSFIQRWYQAALLMFLSVGAGGLFVNLCTGPEWRVPPAAFRACRQRCRAAISGQAACRGQTSQLAPHRHDSCFWQDWPRTYQ